MRKTTDRSVFATLIVVALIGLVLVLLFFAVDAISRERCEKNMADSMLNVKTEVQSAFEADRDMLHTLADVIAGYGPNVDSYRTRKLVKDFNPCTISSRIAVLLPDDTIITINGEIDNVGTSYAEASRMGVFVENARRSGVDNEYSFRNFVPIKRNGNTVAMLYGVILLRDLPGKWDFSAYGGDSFLNLIDRDNETLLLDTRHQVFGPLSQHEEITSVYAQVMSNNDGETSVYIEDLGEEAVVHYSTLGINNWSLAFFVPSSEVFADQVNVRTSLVISDLCIVIILVYYLFWMMNHSKKRSREVAEMDRQLSNANNDIRNFRMKEANLRDALKKSNYQAEHDVLTRLLNRAAYDALMRQLKQSDEDYALLLMDLDNFKEINDTYGHAVGDGVLVEFGDLLKSQFRDTDYPCRIGGDEFAVIMLGVSGEHRSVIERKVKFLNDTLNMPNGELPSCSVSIGIAIAALCEDPELIYQYADDALYKAKAKGRKGYVFHS